MDNFEKKEDVYVNINKMYEYYTESILENSGNVADLSLFHRVGLIVSFSPCILKWFYFN